MNKKAALSDNLMQNIIFLIFLAVFILIMFAFLKSQMSGASVWADYYSKETSRLINTAVPGDKITLDIQKATEIAKKNDLQSFSEIFSFDNLNNEICVKLSQGKKTCYAYFNNVDIVNPEVEIGVPKNILRFEIKEKPLGAGGRGLAEG